MAPVRTIGLPSGGGTGATPTGGEAGATGASGACTCGSQPCDADGCPGDCAAAGTVC